MLANPISLLSFTIISSVRPAFSSIQLKDTHPKPVAMAGNTLLKHDTFQHVRQTYDGVDIAFKALATCPTNQNALNRWQKEVKARNRCEDAMLAAINVHANIPQAGSSSSKLVGAAKRKAKSERPLGRRAMFYRNKCEAAMNIEANISPAQRGQDMSQDSIPYETAAHCQTPT